MAQVLRGELSRHHVTLDAPDKDIARIVFFDNLEMRVETVTVHFHAEPTSLALRTNFYLSALDFCSKSKNCVVRDQSFSFPNL